MNYIDDWRLAYKVLSTPGKATKKTMSTGKALGLYYKLSLIPFILFLIVGYLTSNYGANWSSNLMLLTNALTMVMPGYSALILNAILFFWILVPLGIILNAFLYQIVGKFFLNVWKGPYSKTVTATVFGVLPFMLFYWLIPVPVIGSIALILFGAWDLVVLAIALANQQKTTRLNAALAVILTGLAVIALLSVSLSLTAVGIITMPPAWSSMGMYV